MFSFARNGMVAAAAIAMGTTFVAATLPATGAQALTFRNFVKKINIDRGCGNDDQLLFRYRARGECNRVGAPGGFAIVPPGGGTIPGGGRGNAVSAAYGFGAGFGFAVAISGPSGGLSFSRGLSFKRGIRVDARLRSNLISHSSSAATANGFGIGTTFATNNASGTGTGSGQGAGNYDSTGGASGSGTGIGGGTANAGNNNTRDSFNDFGGSLGAGAGLGGGTAIGGTFGN